jgi:hypothetical protein
MKQLNKNWLTEGLIDFEYKKYVLLAYLQEVKGNFDSVKLFPHLSDLVFHYQNLLSVKHNKDLLYENFPKEISKADFEKLKLQYKRLVEDDDLMRELEEIIFYAIPQIKILLDEGKDLYESVEENLEISPVGITPLNYQEGYFFISEQNVRDLQIYEYQLSVFENANENFRGIHIRFLETVAKSITNTFENVKLDLVRRYQKLPNPATYIIYCKSSFPMNETLLPVAKRMLVRYVTQF